MRAKDACKTWEFIRSMGRTTIIEEICSGTGLNTRTIHEHVDLLIKHELVKKIRARKPRIATGYRSLTDQLVISFDEHDESVTNELLAFLEETRKQFDADVERHADQDFHPKVGFRFHQRETAHFTKDEFAELKRRMLSVVSFLIMPRNRKTQSSEDADGSKIQNRFCNQAIKIELTPLTGDLLPKPSMIMSPGSQLWQWDNEKIHSGGMSILSPREREVVMALADGLSRAQIADRMEVSVNTISTLTQRAYKKIGVTSQAQLAAQIKGDARSKPPAS